MPDARIGPLLVIDGTESIVGRAMLGLSALHVAGAWLDRVQVRFIDIADEDLLLGLNALEWDRGITIERRFTGGSADDLAGARLYAAIAFRSANHLRLGQAQAAGIETLVALQFPDVDWSGSPSICNGAIAFDAVAFADKLGQTMAKWL